MVEVSVDVRGKVKRVQMPNTWLVSSQMVNHQRKYYRFWNVVVLDRCQNYEDLTSKWRELSKLRNNKM